MSQIFDENKKVVPVTLIEAGPCFVSQIRTPEKDGYSAVQIGFDKTKKANKPLAGHLRELGGLRYLREFLVSLDEVKAFEAGQEIKVDIFEPLEKVQVSSVSKGKGFAGVVKRHGFSGGPASHGQKHSLRAPGSIGSSFPERVWKGKRMAGRMGSDRTTVKNLRVMKIDLEDNVLAIKGAVPGPKGALVAVVREK